jgi:hypothetical protein
MHQTTLAVGRSTYPIGISYRLNYIKWHAGASALPQLAVWDFWPGFARACGIFLRESLSKVAADLDPNLLLL